jgi:hypothetical protein
VSTDFCVAAKQRRRALVGKRGGRSTVALRDWDMKKSALHFEREGVSSAESPQAIPDSPNFKVVPYPSTAAVSIVESTERQSRSRKRRKRLRRFIKLEASALVILVLTLFAGTSQSFAQPSLTLPFEITIGVAAVAVAIIPVIFYGLPRPKYRYRER